MRSGGITVVATYVLWIHHVRRARARRRSTATSTSPRSCDLRRRRRPRGRAAHRAVVSTARSATADSPTGCSRHRSPTAPTTPAYLELVERVVRPRSARRSPAVRAGEQRPEHPAGQRALRPARPPADAQGAGPRGRPVAPTLDGDRLGRCRAAGGRGAAAVRRLRRRLLGRRRAHAWDPTFREHFFFSHTWDDPGIGADLRDHPGIGAAETPACRRRRFRPPPANSAGAWPPRTTVGRGRAARTSPRSRTARSATARLGRATTCTAAARTRAPACRSRTPPATRTTCPSSSYDFHAPIGEAGQLAASHAELRRQHAFLTAFGDGLAAMPSTIPELHPTTRRRHRDAAVGAAQRRGIRMALRHLAATARAARHRPGACSSR